MDAFKSLTGRVLGDTKEKSDNNERNSKKTPEKMEENQLL